MSTITRTNRLDKLPVEELNVSLHTFLSIEHGYRFDQEAGLDVEDLRVETRERMRRLFMVALLSAQVVCFIAQTWSASTVRWLPKLGGKLGLKNDLDGLYVLLRGISAVWQTVSTWPFLATHPFPPGICRCVQSPRKSKLNYSPLC